MDKMDSNAVGWIYNWRYKWNGTGGGQRPSEIAKGIKLLLLFLPLEHCLNVPGVHVLRAGI